MEFARLELHAQREMDIPFVGRQVPHSRQAKGRERGKALEEGDYEG